MSWILEIRTDALTSIFSFFSYLGYSSFLVFFLSIWYWNIQRTEMLRLGILLLLSAILNAYLKDFFQDPRPSTLPQLDPKVEGSFGFPSGHAQMAVVVWFYLAYTLQKSWAWIVASFIVIMISLSRLYLGVHDIGDIAGGLTIGAASLLTFLFVEKKVSSSFPHLGFPSLFILIICVEAVFFFTYPVKLPYHVLGYGTLLFGFLCGAVLSKSNPLPWKEYRFFNIILYNVLGVATILIIRKVLPHFWEILELKETFLFPALQGFILGFTISVMPCLLKPYWTRK